MAAKFNPSRHYLEDMLATYLKLQDDSLTEGDLESAEALGDAIAATCAKLDELTAQGL